jgi:hypothetical protein
LRSWNLAISLLGFPRIAWRDSVASSEGKRRPKKREAMGSNALFRARLEQIINIKHELVALAGKIDWNWVDREVAPLYSDEGRPETRFVLGLPLLKQDVGQTLRWKAPVEWNVGASRFMNGQKRDQQIERRLRNLLAGSGRRTRNAFVSVQW